MLADQIRDQTFCIYGAGIVASSVYTALRELYHMQPIFFLISGENGEKEPEEIDGIPVKRLPAWEEELRNGLYDKIHISYYIVAVPEPYHNTVIRSLSNLDSLIIEESQILPVTGVEENTLMESYYGRLLCCRTAARVTDEICSKVRKSTAVDGAAYETGIQVFQAKSHKDMPLHSGQQAYPAYITPIQAGAALTDQVVAGVRDNTGEHISEKNGNYSELTATYYVWRNSRADYKGICHYRRIFDIGEEQMQIMLSEKSRWDVILPYPTVHYPSIAAQHLRYLKDEDWAAMLLALEERAPEYLKAFRKMTMDGEKRFFNFNMLIAKASVFDDYCGFLFQVLERAEELAAPKGWERADRFAGYMGENLTTIYFHKNSDKLRIIYAGKRWLT